VVIDGDLENMMDCRLLSAKIVVQVESSEPLKVGVAREDGRLPHSSQSVWFGFQLLLPWLNL